MKYRADIQILRGIAVLQVILFHLFPKIFPGGFLGVDIFFVISGFLMAAIYEKPGKSNKSYLEFYKRRFYRIIPAFYFITLLTLAIGGTFILPHENNLLNAQTISSLFFIPNIYFFWSGESYFSDIAFRPLLHMWSLGVELQYYLFVPLIMLIFKRLNLLYFLLFIFSLSICLFVVNLSPKTAFFLLPFRAWEFFIGFFLAMVFSQNGNLKFSKLKPLGLTSFFILIIVLFLEIDLSKHPGYMTLLICLLSGIYLIGGIPNITSRTIVAKGLEIIGKYSYSAYLVHYPLIFFYYYQPFKGEKREVNANLDLIFVITLIVILTYITYQLFERGKLAQFLKISKAHSIVGLFIILSLTSYFNPVLNSLFHDEKVTKISYALEDRGEWRCGKSGKLAMSYDSQYSVCLIGDKIATNKKALLVGDSTADALKNALADELNAADISLLFPVESCSLGKKWCSIKNILNIIEINNIDYLFLHDHYINADLDVIKLFLKIVKEQNNSLQIIYIDPLPTWYSNLPQALFLAEKTGEMSTDFIRTPDFYYKKYKTIPDYPQASAIFKRRSGMGGVRTAA